jgi:hypothetical protein
MAKSLRASSKLAARNHKRRTQTSDYAVTAAARLNQVSERLRQRIEQPKLSDLEKEDTEDMADGTGEAVPEAAMEEDKVPKKISTSGPRGSRNELWRKVKAGKSRKSSKNSGRPKRRR